MNCFGAQSDIHIAFSTRRHHEFTASGVAFDSSVSMVYALLKGQIIAFAARTYDQHNLSGAALQCERDLGGGSRRRKRELFTRQASAEQDDSFSQDSRMGSRNSAGCLVGERHGARSPSEKPNRTENSGGSGFSACE